MKKIRLFLVVSIVVVLAGCQQSEQKQDSSISRRDRLVANENINLKNELTRCQKEIEKQQNLLQQCKQEKAKIEQQDGETIEWLMNELPKDLLKDVELLTKENEQLRAEIVRLGGQLSEAEKAEQ